MTNFAPLETCPTKSGLVVKQNPWGTVLARSTNRNCSAKSSYVAKRLNPTSLTNEEREAWQKNGFFQRRSFASPAACDAIWQRAVSLAQEDVAGNSIAPAYTLREKRLDTEDHTAEERISKIFRLHRDEPAFRAISRDEHVAAMMVELIGPDVDCFLSQFIFKHPGSLGQPWHQDAFYFPFDRTPQIGIWLAITEATMENSPLWVLPGSHRDEVHPVITDPRPEAPFGYVEIVDQDTSNAIPVLMEVGDLLIFHSHLMHKSTDHVSGNVRAAMVYHYADAATIDQTEERWGMPSPNNDWVAVVRDQDLSD